jgi:GAF domain-containing protein
LYAGLLLLGLSALLLVVAVFRTAMRVAPKREASLAVVGALLGCIGVIGDVVSASMFILGEPFRFGWIAFLGFPLVNANPLWGSIVAAGSGLMAWSYRRIARQIGVFLGPPTAVTPRPAG